MATVLIWKNVGRRWHVKHGDGAYQIHLQDGCFDVFHFETAKSEPVHRATARTLQGAKDYVAIEVAKREAA